MSHLIVRSDAGRIPLADASVDLVFTSPPYLEARLYMEDGKPSGAARNCQAWIDWMMGVVAECCRVSRGLVLVNCAGVTRNRIYQPGPEGLLYEWWKRGGHCWRPAYWRRVGIPGSGGKHWYRADVEYVLAFKRDNEWPAFSDNTANGHPPKWAPGGEMSYRLSDGDRRNQWGKHINSRTSERSAGGIRQPAARPSHFVPKPMYRCGVSGDRQNARLTFAEKVELGAKIHTKRDAAEQANGDALREQAYLPPVLANPGNVVNVKVGGGQMGHPYSHDNEAPFPVEFAEWFIRSHCPPDGIVYDPCGGSGTTAHAADNLGRHCITSDLRMSQCLLMRRRLATPYAKRSRPAKAVKGEMTLFGRESA